MWRRFKWPVILAALIVVKSKAPVPMVYVPDNGIRAAALYCVAPRLGVIVRATPSISVDTTDNKFFPADAMPGPEAYNSVFD